MIRHEKLNKFVQIRISGNLQSFSIMSDYTNSVINKWLNVSLAHVSRVKRRSSNKAGTKHFQLCLFGAKITIIIIAMCFQENSSL